MLPASSNKKTAQITKLNALVTWTEMSSSETWEHYMVVQKHIFH